MHKFCKVPINLNQSMFSFVSVHPKRPNIMASPVQSTLLNGTKFTLTCHTKSPGQISYSYFHNGQAISTAGHSENYTVNSLEIHNSGFYTCLASIYGKKSLNSSQLELVVVGKYSLFVICHVFLNLILKWCCLC